MHIRSEINSKVLILSSKCIVWSPLYYTGKSKINSVYIFYSSCKPHHTGHSSPSDLHEEGLKRGIEEGDLSRHERDLRKGLWVMRRSAKTQRNNMTRWKVTGTHSLILHPPSNQTHIKIKFQTAWYILSNKLSLDYVVHCGVLVGYVPESQLPIH